MIVAGDGVPANRTSATPVSLVDAYPTVLDGVGLSADPDGVPGRSLFAVANEPEDRDRAYMLRKGRFKYIHYVGFSPELFDFGGRRRLVTDEPLPELSTRRPEDPDPPRSRCGRKPRWLLVSGRAHLRLRADLSGRSSARVPTVCVGWTALLAQQQAQAAFAGAQLGSLPVEERNRKRGCQASMPGFFP
ncbi:hypothetical protein FXB41_13230 [Bradyrhizobium canariense]|uniref:hypothetical protein n=1 Tax=Bradyrhizobium canariense TaxID=255045 RepID=UPI001CA55306|nr:hypothetical protein [Bradyrhizobium canariense]MBW5435712.1 hypothetical protein [Bradyrhizobium canariense]